MSFLYEKIYESLKQRIVEGTYKVGEKIPTEKELAEHYKVSTMTTKRALDKLSDERFVYRKRGRGTFVLEQDQGKMKADKVKRTKKPVFGLVLTGFGGSFGNLLIKSLEKASRDKCILALRLSENVPSQEDEVIKELLDFGIDGLIISPAVAEHYSVEILKMVIDKFPLIVIDRAFKGLATSSVSTDNEQAAKIGINHLFALGHKDIGILIPKYNRTTTIEDRIKGIVDVYRAKKLTVNRRLFESDIDSSLSSEKATNEAIKAIKDLIVHNQEITALYALEHGIALLAKKAIDQLNLRVPEDISIICFDSPSNPMLEWSYTHIEQNQEKIAQQALEKLIEMYNGDFEIENIHIPAKLVQGDTTDNIYEKK